ncbi:MAG: hypothetical protein DI626_11690 [Micavibrio aeruginosavorus]|uniref:Haem-binding uptake Tiki superfamily ChaN domain-containing protein n=1 Tax=Micavibrio aeruginosavorus TaxID=349221 RepID=A0A2W4Z9Z4_9BACT|nr:MAG: hypothetical protein DI626_11690 [Micavibrio aeruginosavorus]
MDQTAPPLPADDRPGPGCTVDCSAAPFDLRPALDAIMTAENWILDRMPESRKLVIVFGECHSYQTHQFLQQAVLLRHKEQAARDPQKSFAYGYEFEKKFWRRYPHNIDLHTEFATIQWERGLNLENDYPEIYLSAYQKLAKSHDLQGSQPLIALCQREGISVSFNDAASRINLESMRSIIDADDPQVRRIIAEHPALPRGEMYSIGADGMYLRNIAIAENAMEHIGQTDAKIYIQHCGQDHVQGNPDRNMPYGQSLCAQFRQKNVDVLSVVFKCDSEQHRMHAPDVKQEAAHTLIIENMAPALSAIYAYDHARRCVNQASGLNL